MIIFALGIIGGRDNYQHFFVSAFLGYNYGVDTAFNIGVIYEIVVDFRGSEYVKYNKRRRFEPSSPSDMMINSIGANFGMALRENPHLKPSDVIKFYYGK